MYRESHVSEVRSMQALCISAIDIKSWMSAVTVQVIAPHEWFKKRPVC